MENFWPLQHSIKHQTQSFMNKDDILSLFHVSILSQKWNFETNGSVVNSPFNGYILEQISSCWIFE